MVDRGQGTSKSARTKAAIETAARNLFAINGFDRTTVREIGAAAAIDPSMIIRYFGSKEALFSRVTTPDLRLAVLDSVEPDRLGEAIVRHFLAIWEGEHSDTGMRVLLRTATSNDEAAARMRNVFAVQVIPVVARSGPAETTMLRGGLVVSQLLGLAITRYILCVPPVVAMTPDQIVRFIGPTIQSYATGGGGMAAASD